MQNIIMAACVIGKKDTADFKCKSKSKSKYQITTSVFSISFCAFNLFKRDCSLKELEQVAFSIKQTSS